MTTLPLFTIDGYQHNYEAVSYGPTWNGWATPVVTRATFEGVMAENPEWNTVTFLSDGTAVVAFADYPDEPLEIAPDANGNYNLGALGYTFDTVDSDTNAPGLQHVTSIRSRVFRAPHIQYTNDRSANGIWRGYCSCGWRSLPYPTRMSAEREAGLHARTATHNSH